MLCKIEPKIGCANRMASSSSHVAVSESQCFLYTFTSPMVRSTNPPRFHFMVVLHTNSSKSLIACISTHHMIFFWVLENPSPQLGTFPMYLETKNTYAQAPINESIPMLVFIRFSKIIDESHAHVY